MLAGRSYSEPSARYMRWGIVMFLPTRHDFTGCRRIQNKTVDPLILRSDACGRSYSNRPPVYAAGYRNVSSDKTHIHRVVEGFRTRTGIH
ncbi:hypothetical protein TNCT_472341 [Trichonephila clavata]|uniref:Uncharacterized protein n=1 Tax=Trichonephila clavata TaxID=2740835 RepID=A0A8X6IC28_TRICU|nr:hypothetical protein TNCT_472341 [Trichonephila clavata]